MNNIKKIKLIKWCDAKNLPLGQVKPGSSDTSDEEN